MGLPDFIETDMKNWLKNFHFSTEIKIRFGETDAFGHVNNVSYFTYFEQARLDYLEHLHIAEGLIESENMIVTANLECHYLSQLHYGQVILVHVKTSKIGRSSLELEYAITDREEKTIAAAGRGTLVYINRHTNQSEKINEEIKNKIVQFEKMENQARQ